MEYENVIRFINTADDGELGNYQTNATAKDVKKLINRYYKENEEDYNWEDFVDLLRKEIEGEWLPDADEEVRF